MQRVRTLKGSGKSTTTFYYLKTDESTKITNSKSMKNKQTKKEHEKQNTPKKQKTTHFHLKSKR